MSILQRARQLFQGPDRSASKERRKLKRVACQQLFEATCQDRSFKVTVVDVGFGGFRVWTEQSPGERGDLLHLRRLVTDFSRHLTGAYTTGLMVKVAWVKKTAEGYEAGLHLPQAPGSMRISWFRELLQEMGFDEKTVFTQRSNRRHRCRLPAELALEAFPRSQGLVLDLSSGGGLFAAARAATMGAEGLLSVQWGSRELKVEVAVVGLRSHTHGEDPRWLHSLKFAEELSRPQEQVLYQWLDELARNG
ncbi:MAG: PilZ domain-containing protein [Vulcanimicrobiota bacterium]